MTDAKSPRQFKLGGEDSDELKVASQYLEIYRRPRSISRDATKKQFINKYGGNASNLIIQNRKWGGREVIHSQVYNILWLLQIHKTLSQISLKRLRISILKQKLGGRLSLKGDKRNISYWVTLEVRQVTMLQRPFPPDLKNAKILGQGQTKHINSTTDAAAIPGNPLPTQMSICLYEQCYPEWSPNGD